MARLSLSLLSAIFVCDIAIVASALTKMDPDKFACAEDSPSTKPPRHIYSTSRPPVDMTHILCGNIGGYMGASGFHARPDNTAPPCAVAELFVSTEGAIDCYEKTRVWNSKDRKWVERVPDFGKVFCFFPTCWSKKELVGHLLTVYHGCQQFLTGDRKNIICAKNYKRLGFDVVLYLEDIQRKTVIYTAFPVLRGTHRQCDKYCDGTRLMDVGK